MTEVGKNVNNVITKFIRKVKKVIQPAKKGQQNILVLVLLLLDYD